MKLNIACGGNIFPGWVNLDRVDMHDAYLRHLHGLDVAQMGGWPAEQVALSVALTAGQVEFRVKDLREGFAEYGDGTVEAIYLGQCVEHLHPHTELPKLLKECHRMLEPGGAVRITTPDLRVIVKAFNDGRIGEYAAEQPQFFATASPGAQLSYLLFGATGPDCTRENFEGHFHVWCDDDLCALLLECGFSSVGEARSPSLVFAGCKDFGLSHSMALEAVK